MAGIRLQFLSGDTEKGQLPGTLMRIVVAAHREDDGELSIAPDSVGPVELAAEVERLKRELDVVLQSGRQKYEQYHQGLARRARGSA